MSDNVVELKLVEVGEDFRFDPDLILEEAKGHDFVSVAILAERPDGTFWVSGSANAGETLVLMERAKRQIVFGDAD
jgi:hypothetical protein